MEWQPIETAPKDGFIMGSIDWLPYPIVLHWADTIGEWLDVATTYAEGGGYWKPTHWMPLPDPPHLPQSAAESAPAK